MGKADQRHFYRNGYKQLLVILGSTVEVDKVPMYKEYDKGLEGDVDLDKKVVKLGNLNVLTYKNLSLFINTCSTIGKMAFGLAWNMKRPDFPKEITR